MHGDGAQGDVGGVLVGDADGHVHEQVAGHGDHLGVIGVAGAGARHLVSERDAGDLGADADHLADQRVAESLRFGDGVLHRLEGGGEAVVLDFLQDAPHQVGPGQRLADVAFLGQPEHRAIGAGADQRGAGAHQDAVFRHRRRRRVGDGDLAGLEVLDDDFHGPPTRLPTGAGSPLARPPVS